MLSIDGPSREIYEENEKILVCRQLVTVEESFQYRLKSNFVKSFKFSDKAMDDKDRNVRMMKDVHGITTALFRIPSISII